MCGINWVKMFLTKFPSNKKKINKEQDKIYTLPNWLGSHLYCRPLLLLFLLVWFFLYIHWFMQLNTWKRIGFSMFFHDYGSVFFWDFFLHDEFSFLIYIFKTGLVCLSYHIYRIYLCISDKRLNYNTLNGLNVIFDIQSVPVYLI